MTAVLVEGDRRLELTRAPESVLETREWLSREVPPWTDLAPQSQADLLVMASELVSNVLLHTTSDPCVVFGVRGECVRLGVTDHDPGRPEVLPIDPHRVGGNGMRVIDAWADSWGVDPEDDGGKTVWILVRLR